MLFDNQCPPSNFTSPMIHLLLKNSANHVLGSFFCTSKIKTKAGRLKLVNTPGEPLAFIWFELLNFKRLEAAIYFYRTRLPLIFFNKD